MKKKRKGYSVFSLILRLVPMQIKLTPFHFFLNNLLWITVSLFLVLNVIATQRLFDAIVAASAAGGGFWAAARPLLVLAAITFGYYLIHGIAEFHNSFYPGKLVGRVVNQLQEKLQKIDPLCFEDTSFLDDLNKARDGTWGVPNFSMILGVVADLFLCYFIIMGLYFFSMQPILPVALMLSFIPALLTQIVRTKIFAGLEEAAAPLRREYGYYYAAICDRGHFKETRLLGAFSFFKNLLVDTQRILIRMQWRTELKTSLLQLFLNLTTFSGMAVSSVLLFNATMSGEITIGAFAAVFGALVTLFDMMQEVMRIGSRLSGDTAKIANYLRIIDMPERTGAKGEADFSKGVSAQGITFTYPGRTESAVKNVSLTIADGETIAIVGENGSGKSTLVRLLTGIYLPEKGSVTVGGLNTALTDMRDTYQKTSGVFQNFKRYAMTLSENVAMSKTDEPADENRIKELLTLVEADMEGVLPDTMLSPEFGGTDLSGGQWQRVAIARGLYRTCGFIVLDEPTAAIDPMEEQRVYNLFRELAKNKCAVIITHRLGSVKLANRIAVMDAGEIVDTGTHEELLKRGGKYAQMWEAQAFWYM
jgi:ATP-binding cassette subfamily B protein